MTEAYILKHKDENCAGLSIENSDGSLSDYISMHKSSAPFLGNDFRELVKKWWLARCVPASRKMMQRVIRLSKCETSGQYLAKNLALSMTDCYWICPVETDLRWDSVNLRKIGPGIGEKIPYHSASTYDPNASLGGQMEKYWDLTGPDPILVKTAGGHFGQQALNELFATEIHRAQEQIFPYVTYSVRKTEDGDLQSLCKAFTSDTRELIPAMEVLDSEKRHNDESLYDSYIRICSKNGIEKNYISDYMDYQTIADFVLSNTDEHLMNFGVLRDPETLHFIDAAPIFDSGNAMFFSEIRREPYKSYELLARKITSFHDTEEAMLRHVKNRLIFRADALPSAQEVRDFYANGGIPEEKAVFIAGSYEKKVQLLTEFQAGKTISLYYEKQRCKKGLSEQ